jgi:hypothetical protein
MSTNNGIWAFETPIAELRCGGLRGRVNVREPQLGVHDLHFDGLPLDGALLAVSRVRDDGSEDEEGLGWPVETADVYVREGDLIATYRPAASWPFTSQVYWSGPSREMPSGASELSLVVSVQTDLLDTRPEIRVTTRLPAVEVMELPHDDGRHAQALLWRLVDRDWSYLEYVPRSDSGEVTIDADGAGRMTCEWRLLGEFLEKGVIRRARVSAAMLPREGDEKLAAECCRVFANRPLPLTT